jgi:hypothetical protein
MNEKQKLQERADRAIMLFLFWLTGLFAGYAWAYFAYFG